MPLRSYDPTIARWNRIDPVTHFSQSTYNGMDNNPVFFSDPSGADAQSAHELYHNGAPARLNTRDFHGGRAHDYATRASTAAGGYEDNNKNGTRNYGNDLIGALNDLGVEYTIGGTDPESDPMFPFTSGVQGMDEIIVTAPKNSGGFDENTPDWIRNMKVGSYETPFRGSLADYNRKYGTNYTSDNTYAQYYYQTSYKPQLSALRGSIQAAQTEVGLITLATPVLIIGTVSSASSIVALGLESSSVSSLTYSTMWRQGVYRLSVRNSLGQFATGNGTQLAGRVFHQYYGLNGLGQATSFTSTIARGIPTAVRWAIGVGGSLLVANDRHGNRPSIRHRH